MRYRDVRTRLRQSALAWQASPRYQWGFVAAGGVVCFLLLGVYLRLEGFSASLWLDEFGTLWAVERDLITTLQRSWQFHGQSPFYYILVWIPLHLVGESEAALRAPSLLFVCSCVAVLYFSARTLGTPKSGVFAVLLAWLSVPVVKASVEARPYGLVLLTVAIAITGFQWAVLTGVRKARLLWVLGGAMVAWTHYLQYPVIVGLILSYAFFPVLRTKYTARCFFRDIIWHFGLVALCVPQILALFSRRHALLWFDRVHPLAFLPLFVPLIAALFLGELGTWRETRQPIAALRWALWVAVLTHVGTLELAAFAGVNLLHPRYLIATLVPAILLASTAFARLPLAPAVVALVWFGVLSGLTFIHTKAIVGTYSGNGVHDWRGAVSALSKRLERTPDALVLFRSGFVEEDSLPLGSPPAATLAPLRSPGDNVPRWTVKSLTFSWNNPAREGYFEQDLKPVLAQANTFLVLGARYGSGKRYLDELVGWVQRTWPGRYQCSRDQFRGVEVLAFQTEPDEVGSAWEGPPSEDTEMPQGKNSGGDSLCANMSETLPLRRLE